MCSEKVNKSHLNLINFCASLTFAHQKYRKINSAKYISFFMYFDATEQVFEEKIWFLDYHNSADEY